MASPAPFSRLQLAAALLEYDNDPDDPNAPRRSAHESVIFSNLRRNNGPRPSAGSRKSADYLSMRLPSETGSIGGRESVLAGRRSRGSIDALHNPFGTDGFADEDDEEERQEGHDADGEEMEVDLSSWGLDAFIPKEKEKGKSKGKGKLESFPNPHPESAEPERQSRSTQRGGGNSERARSSSLGPSGSLGMGGAFLEASTSSGLDELLAPQRPLQRRRTSSHMLIETLPITPPLHSIPFPTGSTRSLSPGPEDAVRPASRSSRLDLNDTRSRAYSSASMGSKMILNDNHEGRPDSFYVKSSSPDRASRFDAKYNRGRAMSSATMGTMLSRDLLMEENPFTLRPPSPSRSSRFDPKVIAHGRTMSNASMGTQMMLDHDEDADSHGRRPHHPERPLSTLEMLRPKILVMPSPLQHTTSAPSVPTTSMGSKSGFLISTDGPPLPPGARSARRASSTLSVLEPPPGPVASNSFIPNPRASLSFSQLAFRNTLTTGGQRDSSYADIDRALPRAMEEGEQVQLDFSEEETAARPLSTALSTPPILDSDEAIRRPAGKLYGKSLIDDLEARKAQMRQKQRVFTGDDRPSMMARGQVRRSTTLIDPESLRPVSTNLEAMNGRPGVGRRNSTTLLDISRAGPELSMSDNKMSKSRSVFGVDTIWEQEMLRLREIEDQERKEAEQRKREEEAQATKKAKSKAKDKGKDKKQTQNPEPQPEIVSPSTPELRVSEEPPALPPIPKTTVRRVAPPVDQDSTASDSDESGAPRPTVRAVGSRSNETAVDRWVTESSDEEGVVEPKRTIGVGPRFPRQQQSSSGALDDSEEDLPLVAAAQRAAKRATQIPPRLDSDDEDQPLSAVLNQAKLNLPAINFDNLSLGRSEDDDNKPLGLRASRFPIASDTSLGFGGGDDDDDKPLAFHPEQQRRTQYQMFAQAQQQQQLMMQAQLHNSMFFGAPAMMGSGFFPPPMVPPPMMMHTPVPMPSPPPVHETVHRVDRWRRDVAVEGDAQGGG